MRRVLLVLVVVAAALGVYAAAPGTDLGGVAPGGAAYLPPEPNGFLYVLYETDEYSAGLLVNGIATAPSYGWISVDDCNLDCEGEIIGAITCWIINYVEPSGFYMRFWNDTGGSGPGAELDSASATYELISTGEYSWGYLLYECDIDFDPDYMVDAEHFWWGVYFSSGFWYTLVRTNAYDYQCYFDQSGGGSGPWYSSQSQWGQAYDFFQIIESGSIPDEDPPYVTDMDPDDGDDDVPLDADIVFHCVDERSRVDIDTIVFTVQDQSRRSGDGALRNGSSSLSTHDNPRSTGGISGTLDIDNYDPFDIICTFTPDEELPVDLITCTVDGCLADRQGNEMGDDFIWTFSTGNYGVEQTTWGAIKAEF
jgi:hypothetical protein